MKLSHLKKSKMLKFSTLINLKGWRQLEVLYFKTLTIYLKVIDNLRISRFLQNSHIQMDIFLLKINIFYPQLNIYILNWLFLATKMIEFWNFGHFKVIWGHINYPDSIRSDDGSSLVDKYEYKINILPVIGYIYSN